MSEHTPGPWAAVGKSVRTAATIGRKDYAPNGYQGGICNCFGGSFDKYEQDNIAKANARLIAAAPEMLEVLEKLVDLEGDLPGNAKWYKLAIDVIAKAKGESVSPVTSDAKSE